MNFTKNSEMTNYREKNMVIVAKKCI